MALGYRGYYIFLLSLLILRNDFFRERHTTRRNIRRGGYHKRHTGEKTGPSAPIETQSLIHNISDQHNDGMTSGPIDSNTQIIQEPLREEGDVEDMGHNGTDLYAVLPLDTGLKPKSTFTPHNVNASIDLFTNLVKKDVYKLRKKHQGTHSCQRQNVNFTKQDWLNINNLKRDTSIIIKPADKGGALVIMDRTYYIKEIETQLTDNTNYLPIGQDPTHTLKHTLDRLNKWALSKGIISDGEYKYMNLKYPRIPVFYTLPKIHKNPLFPPGRPIVSGTGSIFQHPAEILDKFLIKYVSLQKSYLKDTTTFLTLLADIQVPP
ncbi:Hypothetical predicted protein, partial [Pelobates cultripes]